MNVINCNPREFENIKNNKQKFKIFEENNLEYLEIYTLNNSVTNEKLNIQITQINEYKTIEDVLKIIKLEQFGKYESKKEFMSKMKEYYKLDNFTVCRLKNLDDDGLRIDDLKLLDMIDEESITNNTLGLSGCKVLLVKTKDKKDAILKIQDVKSNDTIKEEYDVLKYLEDKLPVAKVYYYNRLNDVEYLLRECLEGEPIYKFKNFGFKLGQELKKIHSLYDETCTFNKFSSDELLANVLSKLDVVYNQRNDYFKDYTKEEFKEFMIKNKPVDDSLIHGDFSLTNILVDKNNNYKYIDLGNLSISTKYFDLYVVSKSFRINNLESEIDDFLRGYGIDEIDEKYLNWMYIVEKSY